MCGCTLHCMYRYCWTQFLEQSMADDGHVKQDPSGMPVFVGLLSSYTRPLRLSFASFVSLVRAAGMLVLSWLLSSYSRSSLIVY
jgi:hypothetical protein